jgi:hypothetical protein
MCLLSSEKWDAHVADNSERKILNKSTGKVGAIWAFFPLYIFCIYGGKCVTKNDLCCEHIVCVKNEVYSHTFISWKMRQEYVHYFAQISGIYLGDILGWLRSACAR